MDQRDFHEAVSQLIVPNQGREMLFLDSVGSAELFLAEEATSGPTKFRGKFQEANKQNKNKRLYSYDILEQNKVRLMETIQSRGLVGELDHPTDSIIHFDKCSHVITDLWWDGDVLMGEGEILPTPHGMILDALIKAGVRVGISSRGVGNGQVNSEGVLVIGESYKLITFDAVADPSTFAAYQKVVTGDSRHENIAGEPILTGASAEGCTSTDKNEATRINKVNNPDAYVAYLGHIIRQHAEEIKNHKRF